MLNDNKQNLISIVYRGCHLSFHITFTNEITKGIKG